MLGSNQSAGQVRRDQPHEGDASAHGDAGAGQTNRGSQEPQTGSLQWSAETRRGLISQIEHIQRARLQEHVRKQYDQPRQQRQYVLPRRSPNTADQPDLQHLKILRTQAQLQNDHRGIDAGSNRNPNQHHSDGE
ncbi:hypothetical protein D3C74_384690 [compost metagenome]